MQFVFDSTLVALRNRPGAVYNSRVFESSTFGMQGIGMGSLEFADAKITNGMIFFNTDFTFARSKFIFSSAKSYETLFVITVPCNFLGMLKNWLAWAKRSNLDNFVIFAMDIQVYAYARVKKLPYVRFNDPSLLFGGQYDINEKNMNNSDLLTDICHSTTTNVPTYAENVSRTFVKNHYLLHEEYLLMERKKFLQCQCSGIRLCLRFC